MSTGIQLVGGDSAVFQRFLETDDPCFGKAFAVSAQECQECLCPVVVDGKLMLLREACQALCRGVRAGVILKLTSRQVEEALTRGDSLVSIWKQILNGCDPTVHGSTARTLLKARTDYLENNRGMPHVAVPHYKELVTHD